MAVSTSPAKKAAAAYQMLPWTGSVDVPQEMIELLAYEKYQQRGRTIGHDWGDWFEAERELRDLFGSIQWMAESEGTAFTLRPTAPSHAIQFICRYLRYRSYTTGGVGGGATCFRVVWPPDEVPLSDTRRQMKLNRVNATPEQIERAKAARSPIAQLSGDEFARFKGRLVALLVDGPEKGKVIADAPLDQEHPETPRRSIREQVERSPYNRRRYQLCQILDKAWTD